MKLLFAFGFIPVPVFYVSFVDGGISPCFFILINSKYKDDAGLHAHELGHIEHSYKLLWLGWLVMYFASKQFRQADEVTQYRKQMKFGLSLDRAAELLATNYRLNITLDRAKELLRD